MATQRYQTIMKDEDRYYSKNCPVCLSSYAILYDHKEKKYIAQLKLKNCSSKTIDSVRLNLRAYNQFGELSEELNNCEYTAVNASSGSEFGAKSLKPLSGSASVKRLGITINNVVFTDGQEWASDEGESMEAKVDVEPLASSLSDEEIEAYRTLTNPKMQYVPFGCDPSWVCSCGELNYDSSICTACGSEKTKVFECIEKEYLRNTILKNKYEKALSNKKLGTISSLQQAIAQFEELGDYKDSRKLSDDCKHELVSVERAEEEKKQEEERQAELQRKEADEKAKKNKKVAIIAAAIAIVCITGFLIVTKVITPNNNYNAAVKLMENGDYDSAIAAFESLGDYRDSEEKIKECKYQEANALMENGSYAEALAIYTEIKDFSDSETKTEECKAKSKEQDYNNAIALMNSGDYEKAIKAFEALEGYKDSNDKITECENEIKYQEAISLLSYEDPDYENNAKAKTILEELGDYKDAKDYLSQIYLVLTSDSSHYLKYDEYGHVVSNYDSAVTQEYDDDGRIVKLTIEGDTPLETNYTCQTINSQVQIEDF